MGGTFKSENLVWSRNAGVCNDNIAALSWGLLHSELEQGQLVVPGGGITLDKLDVTDIGVLAPTLLTGIWDGTCPFSRLGTALTIRVLG